MRRLCILLGMVICVGNASASTVDEQREDFNYLRSHYVERSPTFTNQERSTALRLLDRLVQEAPMSSARFALAVAEVAACADNAHDLVHMGSNTWKPSRRFPLRLVTLDGEWVVARAGPSLRHLVGGKIIGIDGKSSVELRQLLRRYNGGIDAYRRWNAAWIIENGELLRAAGIPGDADKFVLHVELRDGTRAFQEVELVAREALPPGMRRTRYFSNELSDDEAAAGWQTATLGVSDPMYLQEPNLLYRFVDRPDVNGAYVQLRSNMDEEGQAIEPFLTTVIDRMERSPPENIVIDLRFDVGGNFDLTRPFVLQIGKTVRDRIYVLLGPHTFSAGIVTAAAIKREYGDRVTLVGEPVGDSLRFWSEGRMVCLPNSGLCVHAGTGLWDLEAGCKGESACYGDRFDAIAGDLALDIPAPVTRQHWLENRDPGIEAVARDVSKRSR